MSLAAEGKPEIWHCVPRADLREHVTQVDCWCKPEPHWNIPNYWIHNSMDLRELYERGERKPS